MPQRETILDTAKAYVTNDRQHTYGHPQQSLTQVAALWAAILRTDVQAHQVALCMILLKAARATNTPNHPDTWVDIAGYAAIGGELTNTPNSQAAGNPLCPQGTDGCHCRES